MFVVLVNYTFLLQCRANFVFLFLIWLLYKQHSELFTISCGAFKSVPVLRETLFPLFRMWFSWANELELDSKEKEVMCSQLPKLDHQPGVAIKSVVASSQKCLELSQTILLGFSDLQSALWVIPKSCSLDTQQAPGLTWADRFDKAIAVSGVGSKQTGLLWGRLTTTVRCWTCHWSSSCLSLLMYTVGIVIMFTARMSGR